MHRIWTAILATLLVQAGCAAEAERPAIAEPDSRPASTQPADELNLIAMGDWGEDTAAEREVAAAMASFAGTDQDHGTLKAALLCGDNFYFKLTGIDDLRWHTLFEKMDDPRRLDFPFYACLGNHDYDGNNLQIELAYARQHPESRFKLPSEWYRVDVPKDKPMATIIFLDSNKENMSELQWNRQVQWLDKQLAGPRARWTICVAHHPLFSNGFFWGNGPLQHDWGTLFQKYKVDFYLCGHEHDVEHMEIPKWFTSFVIDGGGGAHPHPLSRDDRGFSREAFGFVAFDLTPDQAIVRFIGTDGKPMHVFQRSKAGEVKVLETTANTPRTNPLKAYLQMKNEKATR
jgi:hypothetical protein